MKEALKVALRLSTVRERLNELGGKADLTVEERAEIDELTAEYGTLEARGRALAVAQEVEETTPAPVDPDRAELENRADLADIYAAAVEGRSTTGATAELQDELGLSGNQVPLSMIEERTTGVTPAPGDVGANQAAILPAVFPMSCHAWLGIPTPRVGVGEAVYPVLTSRFDPGTPAKGADQDHGTGAFDAEVLSPSRIQASFFYAREDRARFRGMAASLRENLRMALMDKLDEQILAGSANGLFGRGLTTSDVSAQTTFATYLSGLAYGRVDGRYAGMTSDLRVLVGAATYAHMGNAYRNNSVDRNVLDRLMSITGGVKVSAHVPAVANKKQPAIVRRGMRRAMVAPVWEGITLIPDEITMAKAGEIIVTAVMLHAVKIIRTDDFHKQAIQVAA